MGGSRGGGPETMKIVNKFIEKPNYKIVKFKKLSKF